MLTFGEQNPLEFERNGFDLAKGDHRSGRLGYHIPIYLKDGALVFHLIIKDRHSF